MRNASFGTTELAAGLNRIASRSFPQTAGRWVWGNLRLTLLIFSLAMVTSNSAFAQAQGHHVNLYFLDFVPANTTVVVKIHWHYWEDNGYDLEVDSTNSQSLVYDQAAGTTKTGIQEDFVAYSGGHADITWSIALGGFGYGLQHIDNGDGQDVVFNVSSTPPPEPLKPCDLKSAGNQEGCCGGMARYSAHSMLASLNIVDSPIRYTPPRGPSIDFTVTYNQKEI